jgi:hypothetical protein
MHDNYRIGQCLSNVNVKFLRVPRRYPSPPESENHYESTTSSHHKCHSQYANQPVQHEDGSKTALDTAFPNHVIIEDEKLVEQIEAGFVPRNMGRPWGWGSAIGTRGVAYLTIENSESSSDDCPMCLRCTNPAHGLGGV